MNPVIRQILANINVLSKELENGSGPPSETPSASLSAPALVAQPGPAAPSSSAVEEEVARSFRGTPRMTNTTSASSSAPRFRLAYNFTRRGNRGRASRSRCDSKNTQSFIKDVILLGDPQEDKVPRQGSRVWLMENSHIVSGAEFRKEWNALALQTFLKGLFPLKLGEFDDVEVLMPVHSKLMPPHLAPGQQLSGFMLQKVFKDKPVYIRPSRQILEPQHKHKKRSEDEAECYDMLEESDNEGDVLVSQLSYAVPGMESQTDVRPSTTGAVQENPSVGGNERPPFLNPPAEESTQVAAVVITEPAQDPDAIDTSTEQTPQLPLSVKIDEVVPEIIMHCKEKGIYNNPVDILRYMQSQLVRGRALDVQNVAEAANGPTSFILIERTKLLETALDEIYLIPNKFLTLEVQFYNEQAEDLGGPRKEFFALVMREIKKHFFDDGLKEQQAHQYQTIGLIMGLSMLQNGQMPRFLNEVQLDEIFTSPTPSPCLLQVRIGLQALGIFQVANEFPIFLHLLRPSEAALLTLKKITCLIKAVFSEEGSNKRRFEGEIYRMFVKYMREAAGGRRQDGRISLADILRFTTGSEEEPVLGFEIAPALIFTEVHNSFLPTASTCINQLQLPRPTINVGIPPEEFLFNLYDMAFGNTYFGLM